MKKMIKNLMLVAVAAMAFVGCQQDIEVNSITKKTTIEFIADIENETRSSFGEKVDGYYTSTWTGNETAKFNVWNSTDGNLENTESTIKDGRFSVEFINDILNGYIIDAYTPAASWSDASATWHDNYSWAEVTRTYTIPTEQTPTANSVDEKAHILKATASYDGSSVITLNFEHQVAYGKLSFKNLALEEGDSVASVVLDIDGKKYTINTSATEGIWFACEPTAAVTDMTVSVNSANGKGYTKAIVTAGDKTLAFNKGGVSTFTVNMEGIGSGEVADTFNPDVVATNLVWDGSGYFKLTGEVVSGTVWGHSNDYIRIWLNSDNRPNNNSIVAGTYTGCGSQNPDKTQFGARFSLYWGNVTYPSAFGSASTLKVSTDGGIYTIILTHNGVTYGYKGLPEGWPTPGGSEGGEEPEQPEQPELTALDTPEVTATASETDNSITVSWSEVANAVGYKVTFNGITETVTATTLTKTYKDLDWGTKYNVEVVAVAATDSEEYKDSAAGTASDTTIANPNTGGGDEPVTYDPWVCDATISGGNGWSGFTITLEGKGDNTDTLVLSGVKMGDTSTPVTVTKGSETGTGNARIEDPSGFVVFNVTVGKVTYIGTSSNSVA